MKKETKIKAVEHIRVLRPRLDGEQVLNRQDIKLKLNRPRLYPSGKMRLVFFHTLWHQYT